MTVSERDKLVLQEVSDPAAIAREIKEFQRSARVLSSQRAHLIAHYPKQWVAVYQGKVAAHGRTLQAVLRAVEEKGLPRGRVIVRFIDKNERMMILCAVSLP